MVIIILLWSVIYLGVAQMVAHKSGGLGVAGSSPVTQTKAK